MNDSKENYELIEINNRYYHYNTKIIQEIILKDPNNLTSEEWYTLIQMLYPGNMIASGLFQPILIFRIGRNGKRIDPPIEAYDSVDQIKDGKCLFIEIMNFIDRHSKLKFNEIWFDIKDKIKNNKEVQNESNTDSNS